jgi:hypothetical protein
MDEDGRSWLTLCCPLGKFSSLGTELYLGIRYGCSSTEKRRKAGLLWHTLLLSFNVSAGIMIGSITSGYVNEEHFCILTRSKMIPMQLIGVRYDFEFFGGWETHLDGV